MNSNARESNLEIRFHSNLHFNLLLTFVAVPQQRTVEMKLAFLIPGEHLEVFKRKLHVLIDFPSQ